MAVVAPVDDVFSSKPRVQFNLVNAENAGRPGIRLLLGMR